MKGAYGTSARSLVPVMVVLVCAVACQGRDMAVEASAVAVIRAPESAESRTLVKFELPGEVAGAEVEFAVVEYAAAVSSSDAAGVVTLDVFPVTTEWDGDTVAWSDGWSAAGGDFDPERHAVWTAVSGEGSVVRFDVTEMAAAWVSGTSANLGLIVRSAPGEVGTAEPAETAGDRGGPVLRIWYTGPERHRR